MAELLSLSRDLLAYTLWADREHLAAVSRLPAEHLTMETGSSFGSVLGTMAHILGAEQTWLSRFLGNPLSRVPGITDYPELETLVSMWEEHRPALEFFLAALSDAQLAADFTWSNTRGETFTQPLWRPVLHMAHHSTYHRGQVTTLLRQLGHEPPSSDLITFLVSR